MLAGLCLASGVMAAPDADRVSFRETLDLIEAGELGQASDAALELRDYVLFPYLEWALARERLRQDPEKADSDVRHFLASYPSLPPAEALRHDWQRSLVRRELWQDFLAAWRDTRSRDLRCYHALARIKLGRTDGLMEEALGLWYAGHSQPRACDPVFAWLEARGELTTAAIGKRLDLAMDAGRLGLAQYLAGQLPDPRRSQTLKIVQLLRAPQATLERLARDHDPTLNTATVYRALYGLALNEPTATARLLPELADAHDFSATQMGRVKGRIGLGFAVEHDARALEWFSRLDPAHLTETTRAWRIRAALYHARWQTALTWIDALPKDERNDPAWRYWRARALDQTGQSEQADAIFADLAGGTGFYAYLAAARGDRGYSPRHRRVEREPALQRAVMALPGVRRARELFAVGLGDYARTEWDRAMRGRPNAEQRQAALLASDWDWHTQSIRALVRGGGGRDLTLRYPLAFHNLVAERADALNLRPAWVLSIMRSESLFQPDVYSYAGAMGLMQLMPGTARQVAGWLNLHLGQITDVLEPKINVALGTRYLRAMLDRFEGNVLAATAAYNAGPNQVEKWLPAEPRAADVWVENIPYVQTRHYVKRVMATAAIFEWRLNDRVLPASHRLRPVGAPAKTLARAD